MIGNSSSGIREAPTFKVPYICIGSRQNGRERSINVIDANYSYNELVSKFDYVTKNKNFIRKLKKCSNVYGKGNVAKKIFKHLDEIDINKNIIQKRFNLIR